MIPFLFLMLLVRFVPLAAAQMRLLLRPQRLPDVIPETQSTEEVTAFNENENNFDRNLEKSKKRHCKDWEVFANSANCLADGNTDFEGKENSADNFEKNTEPQISNLLPSLTDVSGDTENGINVSKNVDNNATKTNSSLVPSLTDDRTESRNEDNVAKNLDESTDKSISNTMPCLTASELNRNLECQYDLLDILVGSDCITSVQADEVRSLTYLQKKNRKLLNYINSSNLERFIEGLEKSNQQHLANLIRKTRGDTSTTDNCEEDDRPLDDADRRPIEKTYKLLVSDIDTVSLADQLFTRGCISNAQLTTITSLTAKTHYEGNRELLGIIMRRSFRQLNIFYDCLRLDHGMIWNVLSQFLDVGDDMKLMKVEFEHSVHVDDSSKNNEQDYKNKLGEENLQLVQRVAKEDDVIQTRDQVIYVIIRGQHELDKAMTSLDYVEHEIKRIFDGLNENHDVPVQVSSAEFVEPNENNASEMFEVDQSSDFISRPSENSFDCLQCEENLEEVSENVVDQEDSKDSACGAIFPASGASNDDQDQFVKDQDQFASDFFPAVKDQMGIKTIGINSERLHTSTSELSHSKHRMREVTTSENSEDVTVDSINQLKSPETQTVKQFSQIKSKNFPGRSAKIAESVRSFFGKSKSKSKSSRDQLSQSSSQANPTLMLPERILLTLGLYTGPSTQQTIFEISLEKRDTINVINSTPAEIWEESAACVVSNVLYAVGLGGEARNELWAWSASRDEWTRRADMTSDRSRHSVTSVGDKIYVLGGVGWVWADNRTLDSILCYDINSNKWSEAGKLCHAVWCAACVTYKHYVYVFGGRDKYDEPVNRVQVYDTATRNVSLASNPMPTALSHMRAVLWRSKALLIGRHTCYIYDIDSEMWQERNRFKTDVDYFGLTLDDNTLYITGGGTYTAGVWTCRDDVKSLLVDDFISDNKEAEWKHHATLPTPAVISAYSPLPLLI